MGVGAYPLCRFLRPRHPQARPPRTRPPRPPRCPLPLPRRCPGTCGRWVSHISRSGWHGTGHEMARSPGAVMRPFATGMRRQAHRLGQECESVAARGARDAAGHLPSSLGGCRPRRHGTCEVMGGKKKRACLLLLLLAVVVFREGDELLLLVLLSLAGRHGVQGVLGRTIGVRERQWKGTRRVG